MVQHRPAVGYVWVAAAVALQSAAAVFGKFGGQASAGRGVAGVFANPWVLAVFGALGLQAVCWVLALRRLPLGTAYPLMSLVLPLTLIASHYIFGEGVGLVNLLGTALIVGGIAVHSGERSR